MPPTIRLARPHDAGPVRAIYAPYCLTPIPFQREPPGVEGVRGRLEEVLGYAFATRHRERAAYRWPVDTSVYVRQGRHRHGVGTALYGALLAVLPMQDYVNAFAGATLPNPGSVRLREAMGFRPVGVYRQVGFKCGAWHDVAWFQRPLGERPGEPAPPRPLEAVRPTAEWVEALRTGPPPL